MRVGAGVDALDDRQCLAKVVGRLSVIRPGAGGGAVGKRRQNVRCPGQEPPAQLGCGAEGAGRQPFVCIDRICRALGCAAAVPAAAALAPRAKERGSVFVEDVAQQAQLQRFGGGGFGDLSVRHVWLLSAVRELANREFRRGRGLHLSPCGRGYKIEGLARSGLNLRFCW
ncbi:MAG: hypothetical protein ABS40_19830 [Agrobacterium sp. SCN 61-19]|nr:MAG: hypothetical protein ABS40_19830 [Agrobacterium sp. SCN 61-19]